MIYHVVGMVSSMFQSADHRGLTALHIAAKYNCMEIAEMLIQHGAQIITKDDTGLTPMHIACMEGNDGIQKILLEHAANDKERKIVSLRFTFPKCMVR